MRACCTRKPRPSTAAELQRQTPTSDSHPLPRMLHALSPSAPPPKRARVDGWVRLRDGVSTYLPLLLMVLLASATWWLVKNAPQAAAPKVERPVSHTADYTMQVALLQRFDRDGRLRVQVEGNQLRHFPDTDTVEVDAVRIRSYGDDGRVMVATAKKAVTNQDATEIQLQGAAQVQRDASPAGEALRFDSEYLKIDVDAKRLQSHLPVTFQLGANSVRRWRV